ncbi:carbohydrate ABC transporter permease [Paenibacillus polymyxa]|jgi:raffinose/stachyose/melibiose transport system permease protein|uniref:Starch degradation products transporter permease AmyC n=1 Tax=Paenibacillus polymyxa TaxID=1406 RepID=A0A0F0G500_PAEPO|nr:MULTISPECIES: carbohydrate ABC transporter permease [Paenibacillus]AHM64226.1 ABC transporter permease [Paenibacillus polymyxa SQR-21]AIY09904.1 sugar ABC transporter permease [Paenibacillus polymyxa]KAE8560956.1 sugar ABC transporter permease [Paenibacillus polymyxa]KAF6582820.1 carbohydrate ABC transporter permease [Paenibacillus sp. EKM211P]KAF6615385.1 carbohydrate ABC transporter permease [Paenibacillus sp. EKM101P]
METNNRYRVGTWATELVMILVALVFLVPFYFLFVNSVKSFGDLLTDSAAWPQTFVWSNYARAWSITRFPEALWNSFVVTVVSNLLLVLISSMAAYRMVRHPTRYNRVLFSLFVAAMVIPFQSVMIPLVKVVSTLDLMNSISGLVICYLGFGAPMSIFLFHGFVKGVPVEVEEAATVDGCTPYGVFFRIVYPLMLPMMVTVIILNTLWIWNDYLLPSLVLQKAELRTIPIATYAFFGQYTKQWDLALPALVLGILPVIAFFLAMQKYIIQGIMAGSVKG